MHQSKSTLNLTKLHGHVSSGHTGMKKSLSCSALPDIGHSIQMVSIVKAPLHHSLSCFAQVSAPPLSDFEKNKDFMLCLATPPDSMDEEKNALQKVLRNICTSPTSGSNARRKIAKQ